MNKAVYWIIGSWMLTSAALADQVISDDHIVMGSQCLGIDCVDGETFAFDTIVLKENNLRILFNDTSNSGSFPYIDWRLLANDSANGGRNHFSIENATSGEEILTLLAGAPESSLVVNASGNLGLGTDTPTQSLHIVRGNTASIRLEQDASQGFASAVWDILVDEDGLRIERAGSPMLAINNDGDMTLAGSLTAGTPAETFPDYVFAGDYPLMPIGDLAHFVSRERHLPGIPSAADVGQNGLNMTEFQVQLLKKVEELTLYTLQQQSQIDALKAQLESAQ